MSPGEVRKGRIALGRRLANYREAAGYTQLAFAPLTNYGRSTIANVEVGGQRAPRKFWQCCDQLLNTGGTLTVQYDEVEALSRQVHAAKAQLPQQRSQPAAVADVVAASAGFGGLPDSGYVGVGRAIVIAARQTSEHAMEVGARAVSETTIEQLRDDAAWIARNFGHHAPAVTVGETLRVRDLAVGFLERTRRPSQQEALYLIAAQTAALLSSASVDLGLWGAAVQSARAADTYGEVIGHAGVRAYARGMQAVIAYWTGRPADAVQHATAAVELAPTGLARVRAYSVLARAWAHRGSDNHVRDALAAAQDAWGEPGEDELHDIVGGEFGFTPSQHARCASTAWLQVGRPADATAAATNALQLAGAHVGVPWPTVQAEARVDLATCQLLDDQLDAAEETLAPLWTMPPDWRRAGLLGRLKRLHAVLSVDGWRQVPKARQLSALVESFTAERPALPSA